MKHLKVMTFLILRILLISSLLIACACDPELKDVQLWKGNHELQGIKRKESVIMCSEDLFSDFGCVSKKDLKKILQYIDSCREDRSQLVKQLLKKKVIHQGQSNYYYCKDD